MKSATQVLDELERDGILEVITPYDERHPALAMLVRRRRLVAHADEVLCSAADAPREIRIAVCRAAVRLVLVAEAKWHAACRAACDHSQAIVVKNEPGTEDRPYLWCPSCGDARPQTAS